MRFKTVIGIMLGSFIGFLIVGLWRGEFYWDLLVPMLIGGTIGNFALAFLKTTKENKQE